MKKARSSIGADRGLGLMRPLSTLTPTKVLPPMDVPTLLTCPPPLPAVHGDGWWQQSTLALGAKSQVGSVTHDQTSEPHLLCAPWKVFDGNKAFPPALNSQHFFHFILVTFTGSDSLSLVPWGQIPRP